MAGEDAAVIITGGPYQGYRIQNNTLSAGDGDPKMWPFAGEVLAECEHSLGFGQVDGEVYTAVDMQALRRMFDDTGDTGTSKLFLDKSKRLGSICLKINDPVHNKYMLKKLDVHCTNDEMCNPIREAIKSAEPSQHYGLLVGGAIVAAVAFTVVGHCFPLVGIAAKIGICVAAGASPFVLDKLLG